MDNSLISNEVTAGTLGSSGNININTGTLSVLNRTLISGRNRGIRGNAGDININATGAVSLRGGDTGWTAITTALSLGDGNGGNINITAASLELINSELLVGIYSGRGSAGNINVRVNGAISVIGDNRDGVGGVFSDVLSTGREAVGNGGNINFVADSLVLSNGGTLLSTTRGQGNAGNINLDK